MQTQLNTERDSLSVEADEYRQQLEEELELGRAEEIKLREKLTSLQKVVDFDFLNVSRLLVHKL